MPDALVLLFPVIDTSKDGHGNAKCSLRCCARTFHDEMVRAGNRCEPVVHEGGAHGYLMRTQELFDETMHRTDEFLASLGWLEKADRQ